MEQQERSPRWFKKAVPVVLLFAALLGMAYFAGLLRVGGGAKLPTTHYEPVEDRLAFLFCPESDTSNFSWQDAMSLEVRRWSAPDGADLWYAGALTADDQPAFDPTVINEEADRTPPAGEGFADPVDAALSLLRKAGYDAAARQLFPVHPDDSIAAATDALQAYLRKTRPYRFGAVEAITYQAKAYYAARESLGNGEWTVENTILLQVSFREEKQARAIITAPPSRCRACPMGG